MPLPLIPFILTPIIGSAISAISNVVNAFSSEKRHKETLEYQRKRDERNEAIAKENSALATRQQEIQVGQAEENSALAIRREEMQVAQMKLSYMQHQDNIAFQREQAELSFERQKELEDFRAKFQLAITEKNLDFQRWRLEQEKVLQAELATYNRETQLLVARYQRETAIALPEVNKLFETWPLRIVPLQILTSHQTDTRLPIRVIIAPPDIDFDKFGTGNQGVPRLEKRLAEDLRQFFNQHYPLNDATRPIEFLDGAWDSKRFHGGSSIKSLFGMLRSESVLVLESEIDGDYLNFRFGYWSAGQQSYSYTSVISNFKYRDIVYESAKARARKWKKTRDLLLQQGKNPRAINEFDTYNLEILEEEEILAQTGVDISQLPPRYKIKNEDFEALSQFLLINHSLVAGLMADMHYLFYYDVQPLLPQYLPDYIQEGATQYVIKPIVSCYQKVLQQIEVERSAWIPDLALDLANSLSHLQDKTWAEGLSVHSLQTWLKVRGLAEVAGFDNLLKSVIAALTAGDAEYVQKLLQYLTVVGESSFAETLRNELQEQKHREEKQRYIQRYNQQEEKRKRGLRNVSLVQTLSGHKAKVHALAISPDGQALVSEANDGSVNIWDLASGKLQHSMRGKLSNVDLEVRGREKLRYSLTGNHTPDIVISPNGQTLVAGGYSDRYNESHPIITIWDIKSGKLCRTLVCKQEYNSVAISPDGQTLVTGKNGHSNNGYGQKSTINIWDIRSGKFYHSFETNSYGSILVAISPNGQTLVTASDKTIEIWDMESWELRHTLTGHSNHTFIGHSNSVSAVVISHNGQTLASGSHDKTIKIWDMESWELRHTLTGHSNSVNAVAISPNGQTLVSGSHDKTIKIWDMESGELRYTLTGHSNSVNAVAISPNGQTLISGSYDKNIKIWDMESGELHCTLIGDSQGVSSVAISPDGQTLVSLGDNYSKDDKIKIWDLKYDVRPPILTRHSNYSKVLAISPNGQTLISGNRDNSVHIWDWESKTVCYNLNSKAGLVSAVAISPDEQTLVRGCNDSTIEIWNLKSGKLEFTITGHYGAVNAVAISPDGQNLVSASNDKTIKIWDLASGGLHHTITAHSSNIYALAISPDGQTLVSGSADNTIKIWDMPSKTLLHTLTGHSDWVRSLAISPNGEILVSGSDDKSIKIWDLKSGELCRTLTEHDSCVWALAISPDGSTLASAGDDNKVFIWRVV